MFKTFLIVVGLFILVAAGYAWFAYQPQVETLGRGLLVSAVRGALDGVEAQGGAAPQVKGSGYIEATTVSVEAEMGGRIRSIAVDEGDGVTKGMVLVRLDDALLQAQLKRALANLHVAQAGLAKVEAGARPQEIRKVEAWVAQVESAEQAARRAWGDAVALRDNPQDLNAQIDLAKTKLEMAQYQMAGQAANKDAAQFNMDALGRLTGIMNSGVDYSKTFPNGYTASGHTAFKSGDINQASDQWNKATNAWWQSWIGLDAQSLEIQGAGQYLSDLTAIRNDPQALKAQAARAESGYGAAQAATQATRAQLALIRAGATGEQKQAARAQVEQAQARADRVAAQIDKMTLRSPAAGVVTQRVAHLGEMAVPNAGLLTVASLDEVTLTIYVPEDEIGQVAVGQAARVSVDSFPGRTFDGQVSFIATEAEFTPKNIQTPKERVNMMFGVKIDIANPGRELKAGMPADAAILVGPGE